MTNIEVLNQMPLAWPSRDHELVGTLGRHGLMQMAQLMRSMGAGQTATYRRFATLRDAGLVERIGVPGIGAVLSATRAGLDYAGLGLPPVHVRPGSLVHDLRCVSIAVHNERRHPDWRVLSEREIAYADSLQDEPTISVRLGRARGRARYHRPDLAMLPAEGGWVAVEVELTAKAPTRLRAILAAWQRALTNERVSRVHYFCGSELVQRAVLRGREAARARDISVEELDS